MNSERLTLETDLLRTFLTVARHQNVTRGAEALHRTQSAVSIQIKRLEECLSVKLFRRESRGVTLTEAGERLWRAADRIVNDLDQTVREFRTDPIGGLVRVGIPDEYGSGVLPAILSNFRVRHPAVEVYVRCGFSVDFPEALTRGELDLAVFTDACAPDGSNSLMRDATVWVASQPYQCSLKEPIPLALYDRTCSWRDMATKALEDVGQPYRIVFSSESTAGIKAAVASGLAVGVLARSTVERSMYILNGQRCLPSLPDAALQLLTGRESSPAIIAMAEAIKNGFAQLRSRGAMPRPAISP